jgi:hypothetical protein
MVTVTKDVDACFAIRDRQPFSPGHFHVREQEFARVLPANQNATWSIMPNQYHPKGCSHLRLIQFFI